MVTQIIYAHNSRFLPNSDKQQQLPILENRNELGVVENTFRWADA